jgi:hypothetical protein
MPANRQNNFHRAPTKARPQQHGSAIDPSLNLFLKSIIEFKLNDFNYKYKALRLLLLKPLKHANMAFIKQQLHDILPLLIQAEAALAATYATTNTSPATPAVASQAWLGWDAWVNPAQGS